MNNGLEYVGKEYTGEPSSYSILLAEISIVTANYTYSTQIYTLIQYTVYTYTVVIFQST